MSKIIGRRKPTEEDIEQLKEYMNSISEEKLMKMVAKIKSDEAGTTLSDDIWQDVMKQNTTTH